MMLIFRFPPIITTMIFLRTPAIIIPGHFLYLPSIRVHIILCFSKKNACLLTYYFTFFDRELLLDIEFIQTIQIFKR
ncbi:hypothetical protein FTO65_21120 [Bacillus cereus]|nr:hypothetical protein [Bacillus cereus]